MKAKLITFFILLPVLEIMGFFVLIAIQTFYLVRNSALDSAEFGHKYMSYVLHPGMLLQECMDVHNPFFIIVPVIAMVLTIYVVVRTQDRRSGIESTNTIYGSAKWETIKSLTRKNIRGKSAFKTVDKDTFMQSFIKELYNGKV